MTLAQEISTENGRTVETLALTERNKRVLSCAYVDAFGADPTGKEDSTLAFILAAQSVTNNAELSGYDPENHVYGKVIVGRGSYKIKDVPLFTGVTFEGQGIFATRVFPENDAEYCFTTRGTKGIDETGFAKHRLIASGVASMSIGHNFFYESGEKYATNAGAIFIKNASYCKFSDLSISGLNGGGLVLQEVMDSDFDSIKIMEVGKITNAYALTILGNENSKDGSNAVFFRRLHIEGVYAGIYIGKNSRHIWFSHYKHETALAPSIIENDLGVVFDSAEISWSNYSYPVFIIRSTDTYSPLGVMFNHPVFISSSYDSIYFDVQNRSRLVISDALLRRVGTLARGSNITISGGAAYDCAQPLVDGVNNVVIDNVNWTINQKPVGVIDVNRLTGRKNTIRHCKIIAYGDVDDNCAIINVKSDHDNSVHNNILGGTKTFAIRSDKLSPTYVDNKAMCEARFSQFDCSETTNPDDMSVNRYNSVLNRFQNGLGCGGIRSIKFEIQSKGVYQAKLAFGASMILVRAGNVAGAMVFCDATYNCLHLVASSGDIVEEKQETTEEGKIYLEQSGMNIIIHNQLNKNLTFYCTSLSAVI